MLTKEAQIPVEKPRNLSRQWLTNTLNKIAPYCTILAFTLYGINPGSGTQEVEAKDVSRNVDPNRPLLNLINNGGRIRFLATNGTYYSLVDHGKYEIATEEKDILGLVDEIPGVWYKNIGDTLPL